MSKVIQVVVSDDEYQAILAEAGKQGRKMSQMARRLMLDGLKPTISFDIKGSDLVGVIKRNDNGGIRL